MKHIISTLLNSFILSTVLVVFIIGGTLQIHFSNPSQEPFVLQSMIQFKFLQLPENPSTEEILRTIYDNMLLNLPENRMLGPLFGEKPVFPLVVLERLTQLVSFSNLSSPAAHGHMSKAPEGTRSSSSYFGAPHGFSPSGSSTQNPGLTSAAALHY